MGWNWSKHWAAHTFLSYVQNFEKSYLAAQIWARNARPSNTIRFLDLGCGAGASTAGTCIALLDSGKFKNIIAHGVDKSPEMINVYSETFIEWLNWRDTSNIRATVEENDAGNYLYDSLSQWDLVTCCYLFCGDKNLKREFVNKKDLIIIDLPANEGYSKMEVGEQVYRLGYDNRKMLDMAFINELGLQVGANDLLPIFTRTN